MARRSTPQQLACARLDGIAIRHARAEVLDADAAVAELLQVPAELAESAGLSLGFYRNEMDYDTHTSSPRCSSYVPARTLTLIPGWIREGARRHAIPALTAPLTDPKITVRRTCD